MTSITTEHSNERSSNDSDHTGTRSEHNMKPRKDLKQKNDVFFVTLTEYNILYIKAEVHQR